jgi:hypothetical protein
MSLVDRCMTAPVIYIVRPLYVFWGGRPDRSGRVMSNDVRHVSARTLSAKPREKSFVSILTIAAIGAFWPRNRKKFGALWGRATPHEPQAQITRACLEQAGWSKIFVASIR